MTENSKIEWCDHTHNEWVGCEKISPACDHCYAEAWAKRTGGADLWAGNLRLTTEANRRKPLRWNREAAERGIRYRVFSASLSDWLDNRAPPEWRTGLFRTIYDTPNLDWLLLSKRIGLARQALRVLGDERFPDNVWLGATIANQEEADRDIPKLLASPARVRFLSIEPLLGPVDLRGMLRTLHFETQHSEMVVPGIDWVIVGGESGAHARPMHPDWVRSLREQCATASVAFFFKQWGEWAPGECAERAPMRTERIAALQDGRWMYGDLTPGQSAVLHRDDEPDVYRLGKKAAGRTLDGRIHDEFP